MTTSSRFKGSHSENSFWYQRFELKQVRILENGQPFEDFDANDIFHEIIATVKAVKYEDDIPSVFIDNFKNHYVLVLDLTSKQGVTQDCHDPELVGEPLRLGQSLTFPLEQDTELIVLGKRISSVAVDKFNVVGKTISDVWRCSPANYQLKRCTRVSVPWLFPFRLRSNFFQ